MLIKFEISIGNPPSSLSRLTRFVWGKGSRKRKRGFGRWKHWAV